MAHTEFNEDETERQTFKDRLTESPPPRILLPESALRTVTRRDFLLFGAGTALAAAGFWSALPPETQQRLGRPHAEAAPGKQKFLSRVLRFDDDVAEALYSPDRLVPTYNRSQALAPEKLRNNYDGQTPTADYLDSWKLTLTGLASGKVERLAMRDISNLTRRFGQHDQVTRLVCVEGWSAIAWWSGLRFSDLLDEYPPAPDAKWARLDSSVNLDSDGNADPYYVSIDLPTARHPQTLIATHQSDLPLTLDHGAPLRLIAPMKLGLKNIKAITKISYLSQPPADYWNERGYSQYDGL